MTILSRYRWSACRDLYPGRTEQDVCSQKSLDKSVITCVFNSQFTPLRIAILKCIEMVE